MNVARQKLASTGAPSAQKELPAAVFAAWSRGDVGAARVLLAEHLRSHRGGGDEQASRAWQERLDSDAYPLWVGAIASIIYVGAWAAALLQNF